MSQVKRNAQRTFEIRYTALRHVANLSPNRVGAADIADLTDTHVRTAQRVLRSLEDWGYLIADNEHPTGYKLNEEKRELM